MLNAARIDARYSRGRSGNRKSEMANRELSDARYSRTRSGNRKSEVANRKLIAAFTLIELSVVIAILLLLSAAVAPNLAAFESAQQERYFMSKLTNLAPEAREKAIALATNIDVEYDDSANQLKLHGIDANGNDQQYGTLDLPSGLKMNRLVLGTTESSPSDWKLNFYPDGTSDGGGIEFTQPDSSFVSLYIDPKNGRAQLLTDRLPDPTSLSWPAGDYVHRSN